MKVFLGRMHPATGEVRGFVHNTDKDLMGLHDEIAPRTRGWSEVEALINAFDDVRTFSCAAVVCKHADGMGFEKALIWKRGFWQAYA